MNIKKTTPAGYVAVHNDLGFFLDPEKFAPILSIHDEGAVLLKLSLIAENFLEVFIKNIRKPGTESYVKPTRYFNPKVELSVALGLPLPLAAALVELNSLRNKFAHKLDYAMTIEDYAEVERKVNLIDSSTVNPAGRFNIDSIKPMFDDGVDSLFFIRKAEFAMPEKKMRIYRLVGAVFILANKCAFFTLNELHRQGRLSLGESK